MTERKEPAKLSKTPPPVKKAAPEKRPAMDTVLMKSVLFSIVGSVVVMSAVLKVLPDLFFEPQIQMTSPTQTVVKTDKSLLQKVKGLEEQIKSLFAAKGSAPVAAPQAILPQVSVKPGYPDPKLKLSVQKLGAAQASLQQVLSTIQQEHAGFKTTIADLQKKASMRLQAPVAPTVQRTTPTSTPPKAEELLGGATPPASFDANQVKSLEAKQQQLVAKTQRQIAELKRLEQSILQKQSQSETALKAIQADVAQSLSNVNISRALILVNIMRDRLRKGGNLANEITALKSIVRINDATGVQAITHLSGYYGNVSLSQLAVQVQGASSRASGEGGTQTVYNQTGGFWERLPIRVSRRDPTCEGVVHAAKAAVLVGDIASGVSSLERSRQCILPELQTWLAQAKSYIEAEKALDKLEAILTASYSNRVATPGRVWQ